MSRPKKPVEQSYYTPEELEILRAQLRENNARAAEAIKKLGVKMNPRIAEAKAQGKLK